MTEYKYGIPLDDLPAATLLFDQAFSGKFKYAIPKSHLRVKFWTEILNTQQILGAYVDNELAGMALLTLESQPGFLPTAKKSLFEVLGIGRGIRAAFYFVLFSKLDKKVKFPNAYVEAISVSEKFRGKGIGSELLAELSLIAKNQGLKTLCLQVIIENESARKLYERLGFKIISTKKTPILQVFAKVSGADLMERNI